MRLSKAIINSSLVLLLVLGLGGCANNKTSTHKTDNQPPAAKVTKAKSSKKATNNHSDRLVAKEENKTTITTAPATVNTPASYTGQSASRNAATVPSTTTQRPVAGVSQNSTSQVVQPTTPNTHQTVTNDEEEQPAAFYYNWVWKDEQGRIHNVNWDLMDRINDNGQISYANHYGDLPNNAVQYDQREFNLHYDGSDQWVVNFDNQIAATPNHGVVNRN